MDKEKTARNGIRVLRPDFEIIKKDDGCYLSNKNYSKLDFKISYATAFVLALHDGTLDDAQIAASLKIVFEENYSLLESALSDCKRFLVQIEKVSSLFNAPYKIYDAESFLTDNNAFFGDISERPGAPRYLAFHLTNNCCRMCAYCSSEASSGNSIEESALELSEIKNVIHEAFFLGVEGILLTGGEPLLRGDIYEIIEYAAALNIFVKVYTKGLLSVQKLQKIDTSILYLTLSMDSHIRSTANYLTGSIDYYDDMLTNFEILNSLNIPFDITVVVTKLTKNDLYETVKFLLGKNARRIYTTHYTAGSEENAIKELYLAEPEKYEFDAWWIKSMEDLGTAVIHTPYFTQGLCNVDNMRCASGWSKVVINNRGEYVYCEKLHNLDEIKMGNVFNCSLLDFWQSDTLKSYVFPARENYAGTICHNCQRFDSCSAKNYCYYNSIKQYGRLYHPSVEVENVCAKG